MESFHEFVRAKWGSRLCSYQKKYSFPHFLISPQEPADEGSLLAGYGRSAPWPKLLASLSFLSINWGHLQIGLIGSFRLLSHAKGWQFVKEEMRKPLTNSPNLLSFPHFLISSQRPAASGALRNRGNFPWICKGEMRISACAAITSWFFYSISLRVVGLFFKESWTVFNMGTW